MIEHLGEQIQERLRLYLKHNNNVPPKKLWYFRDGVSNGQFHQVNSQELPKIQDACRRVVGEGYTPKIVIIVCGKRHHTRFYAQKNDQEFSFKGNCMPGTVVDNTITSLYNYDFYLQAHGAVKGTARPGHYTVTHDDLNLEPNQVQNLVSKGLISHYNCSNVPLCIGSLFELYFCPSNHRCEPCISCLLR